MKLFLIWSSLALAGFIIFFIRLRNRNALYARFRIRLNIIFILFALVPTIPALFFIAQLLTQSTRVMLLPGLGDALDASLETIRAQTESCGTRFFETFPNPRSWTGEHLAMYGIESVFSLKKVNGRVVGPGDGGDLYASWHPDATIWQEIGQGRRSTMVTHRGTQYMFTYGPCTDTTLAVAAYAVDPGVIATKDEITRAIRVYSSLSLLKETIIEKNIIWALAFLFVLALALIASSAARRIAAGISRPVQDLAAGMSRVAEGDLQVTVDTRARDEFAYLIDRFNAMTRDLETGRKKLLEAERLAAWQQVARQISHEIKNSLTPISLSVHRVRNHFRSAGMPAPVKESLATVEEELKSLELLAGEFSRFAKMPKPVMKPFDLNRLIENVRELLAPAVEPVVLTVRLSPGQPYVSGDREQLKRVLINLIKNSAEASGPGSPVTVTTAADPEGGGVLVTVSDRGSGMDEETRTRMFDPYFTSKPRGTGLGLAIVSKIVQEHNADIQVESEPGRGTTVTLRLTSG
ncbi:HAMP domain-containing protein [bacterium]|nr:HAMP domain-containing protein [bacterium]